MLWEWLYLIILIVSLLVSILLMGVAWLRANTPVGHWLAICISLITVFVASYLAFSISHDESSAFFWVRLRLTTLALLTPPFLFFSLLYSGYRERLRPHEMALILAIPALTTLMIWFVPDLMWQDWLMKSNSVLNLEIPTFGRWFLVHSVYSFVGVLAGCVLIFNHAIQVAWFSRRQSWTLLVAVIIPAAFFLLPTLGLTRDKPNPAPISLTIMFAALYWGFFRQDLLRLSPPTYQAIIENMRDAVVLVDASNRVVLMNCPAKRLFETDRNSSDSITGKPAQMVLGERIAQAMAQAAASQKDFETPIMLHGVEHCFDIHSSPILDAHSQQLQYRVFVLRDITERKRIEAELNHQYAELDRFFTVALDLLCIADTDGNFIKLNKAWESILGYSLKELEGRQFLDLVHPDDLQPTLDALTDLDRQNQLLNFTNRYRTHDGDYRYIEWRSHPYGKLIYAAARDITQQVESQRILQERYLELDQFFSVSVDLLAIVSVHGQFIRVNNAWETILGYSLDELVGSPLLDYLHPDDVQPTLDALSQLEQQEKVIGFTNRYRTVDGDYRLIEWQANPNGELVYAAGRDVTEYRQAQQRAFDLALERERRQLLTTFIQNTAHEFRTPLTTINSGAYLMARSDKSELRQQKANQITNQVERITRLVDTLLLMVQLEDDAVLAHNQVAMGDIISIVCEKNNSTCPKNHTLRYETPPGQPLVMGNEEYLANALTQVIDNACRFTPQDGTILLTSGVDDGHFWIEVQDDGPGIAADDLPHIFETFWRMDKAHSTPGFGLGLTIAQRIIESHNGTIEVRSQPGHGTAVRMTLPLRSEQP